MENGTYLGAEVRSYSVYGNAALTGTTGHIVYVRRGTTGRITRTASPPLVGYQGGIVYVRRGNTGAILPTTARLITVFIDGVDRTAQVGIGVTRSMQIGGGSKATCTFKLVQQPVAFRPIQGGNVVIYHRNGYRWFAGVVDSTSEFDYTGSSALNEITVNCVDYGALCDRRIVGREYQPFEGQIASILFHNVAEEFLDVFDITYVYTGDPGVALGDQVYNWITATQVFNGICEASGWEWRVDFYRELLLFPASTGYLAAPFGLAENDGNWRQMTVTRDSSKYRNRVGVRNSASAQPLWSDTFHGDGSKRVFQTMSPLSAKPIIRINGVPQVVVDFADITVRPYDWYWLEPTSVVQNLAHAVLTSGDAMTVTYPSSLSYVAWAQDDAEITANGLFEGIEEVKDVATIDALQAIADALLVRRKVRPITANFETDVDGLEPGMGIPINVPRLAIDDTLMITQVSSEEQGKSFFRHRVRAVNSANQAVSNEMAFLQALIARSAQPKDRVRQNMRITLAETIEGIDNPGLTTGLKNAVIAAPDDGYLSQVTLFFQSSVGSPITLTSSDVVIDVLQDGVSVFGSTKMVWPAGATALQTQFQFSAQPLPVVKGDLFTVQVLSADTNAKDGILNIEMLVK